jgi:hypothetical protein
MEINLHFFILFLGVLLNIVEAQLCVVFVLRLRKTIQ